jgi:hypothetical protein
VSCRGVVEKIRQMAQVIYDCFKWTNRFNSIIIGCGALSLTFFIVPLLSWWALLLLPVNLFVAYCFFAWLTTTTTDVPFKWTTVDEYHKAMDHLILRIHASDLDPSEAIKLLHKEVGSMYLEYWASRKTRDYIAEFFAHWNERDGHENLAMEIMTDARGPYVRGRYSPELA